MRRRDDQRVREATFCRLRIRWELGNRKKMVLVVSGSTARRAIGEDDAPIDSAIVGIIDSMEISKEKN